MKNRTFAMNNNENGFTLVELLIASAISIVLLAVLAQVVQLQGNSFVLQNQLNQMQSNGRGATEFISRAVANAGYNVFRGSKFLAGSDNYISTVYDDNQDGIIQNTEVMTFVTSNAPAGTTATFNINPFFDRDGDGLVGNAETATYPIDMTQTAPPYNIYKILPENSGVGVTRHIMARNIDNLVIRYYDNSERPLPLGVAVDGDGLAIPPYSFVGNEDELNNIRRVEIEVLARTKNKDPREGIHALPGNYVFGSVATLGGASGYNDHFHRQTFNVKQAPRNMVVAPWGSMDVAANPAAVNCPTGGTSVTATLVDSAGQPIDAASIKFVASNGATVDPSTRTTNSLGQATTTVSYGWESPFESVTVSGSSLITVNNVGYPVFNSGTASFQGSINDTFTGVLDPNWVFNDPAVFQAVDTDATPGTDALELAATGLSTAVNGCDWQKYQLEFEMTPDGDIDVGAVGPAMVGGFVRYTDPNNNYSVLVEKTAGNCLPGDGRPYCLKIVKWNGGLTLLARLGANLDFTAADPVAVPPVPSIKYKMLAQVEGDNLRVKIWNANLPTAPANPGRGLPEPNPGNWDYSDGTSQDVYRLETTDSDYAQGRVGFIGDWTNGAKVVFDNFSVSPIP